MASAIPRKMENAGGREYKYFTEISQMMFVFGEVQDPNPETVNLVEDIVRSQLIELVSSYIHCTLGDVSDYSTDSPGAGVGEPSWRATPLRGRPDLPHTSRPG